MAVGRLGGAVPRRLRLPDLIIYGDHVDAFDDSDRHLAILLATHAAIAVAAVMNRETALQLQQGLDSNREIGVAMGVLMSSMKLTRRQAFDILRVVSQKTNRKLRDVATEIADTGALPALPGRRSTRHAGAGSAHNPPASPVA